jgi:HlyD family secretion protein
VIRDTSESDSVVAPKKKRRRGLIVAITVGAIGLSVAAYVFVVPWLMASRTVSADRLRIEQVVRGTFERSISVQGTVDAAVRPTLYSLSNGVVAVHVRAGDVVKKGSLLAEIDDPDLRAEYSQEESRLQQAEKELARMQIANRQQQLANTQQLALDEIALKAASREHERVKDAVDKQVVARLNLEVARDTLDSARTRSDLGRQRISLESERMSFELQSKMLEVDRQRMAVAELSRRLDELKLQSPIDGLVGSVQVQDRDSVVRNQPLMTVVNLDAYEVLVSIPETFADDLANGMKAFMNVQGRELVGTLSSVSPEVVNGHVEGRIVLDKADASLLKQKQRLSAKIVLDSKPNALVVPRGPFVEDGAGRIAYVVDGDLARLRAIKTGAVGVSQVEVLEGLEEGERIVISNIDGFEQADTVLIR